MSTYDRIKTREAVVGVVGLGYVGLPLVSIFSNGGFRVVGFDTDERKVAKLNRGETYIRHIPAGRVQEARVAGFEATTDFARAAECDAILICVPTPLTEHREPDMRFVIQSCRSLAPHGRPGQLLVLESTTYPGTTDELMRPIFEEAGRDDFLLAYSPEREDPNNPEFETSNIPKVVGADSPEALRTAVELYETVIDRVVPVSTSRAAEATKILENTFRAVNIALVNELKVIFSRMGIDVWEVIDAAATKPFGFMKFTPGPGLGGHCIPVDPFYLTWKAREFDIATRFIETAGEVNRNMPHYVISETMRAFSNKGRGLYGAKILLIGLAYKKNVDDARESPSYRLIELFEECGASVDYHDDYLPVLPPSRDHASLVGRESVSLDQAGDYDAVVVATDHDYIDWDALKEKAAMIVDTRGIYRGTHDKVVKA